mmetsp:Transcript_353/g.590  ORF Transcript_353/g.590 Transcript_353/m.590 type:complete len:729 (-) Transcript_353:150-2336(-)
MSEPNQTWRSFARLCTLFRPDEQLALVVPRGTQKDDQGNNDKDKDGHVIFTEPELVWKERVQAWREKFALCVIMLVANLGFLGFGGLIAVLGCTPPKEETDLQWYAWEGVTASMEQIRSQDNPCKALNITMVAIMLTIVAILGIQCLCSLIYLLRFGRTICKAKRGDQYQDAKVIVTIPCYNEGTEELTKTINSVRDESYPNEKKLLLFIADGNKTGANSDKAPNYETTPVILSHLLGYNKSDLDPVYNCDSTGYETADNGEKTPIGNRAKIYHGTTEEGLNFMVIEKCGRAFNADDVGNRGKRDSQILLLQLLNRVMHNHTLDKHRTDYRDLNELEIAIEGALRGMDFPLTSNYMSDQVKYLMAVDADTRLSKDSITQMVYSMETKPKTLALCGETKVDNKDDSWVTKMQVFEYYTNHGLKKAFESVFGTVTCLPGCFTMYRLFDARDASANQHPVTLFACDYVYDRYARNDAVIETLHEKNLYKLGEDRMLTTLMLQKWSRMNLKYVPEAHCYTIVPDEFMVLLSQRRRWINSTFHNMLYLLSVNLGGICCFSMKFILVLDMIGTLILPSSLLYLGMILYDSIMDRNSVSTYTLLVLGFSVFVQIIGPLLRLKIKYLWYAFVFYLIGVPVFYFVLPLYSFWNLDDFSWGTTRVTTENASTNEATADALDEEQGSGGAASEEDKAEKSDEASFADNGRATNFAGALEEYFLKKLELEDERARRAKAP